MYNPDPFALVPRRLNAQESIRMGIEALEGLQAQHSIVIGDTGQGKSWLLNQLLLLTASDGEYGTAAWQLQRDRLKGGLEAVEDPQASNSGPW